MTRAAEAKKEPALEDGAETSASPDRTRPESEKPAEEKSPALVAADLSSVPPATSRSRFFAAGLVLSLLLHAGVLAYLQWDDSDEIGPGGTQLEAVNVDLIPLSEWRSGA